MFTVIVKYQPCITAVCQADNHDQQKLKARAGQEIMREPGTLPSTKRGNTG